MMDWLCKTGGRRNTYRIFVENPSGKRQQIQG